MVLALISTCSCQCSIGQDQEREKAEPEPWLLLHSLLCLGANSPEAFSQWWLGWLIQSITALHKVEGGAGALALFQAPPRGVGR